MKEVVIGWDIINEFKTKLGEIASANCFGVCKGWKPTAIVGILSGGGIPAIVARNYFNLPVYWVEAKSYKNRVKGKVEIIMVSPKMPKNISVLLIDDIWDSGDTLLTVGDFLYKKYDIDCQEVVLVSKDVLKTTEERVVSVRSAPKDAWVTFPWEKLL